MHKFSTGEDFKKILQMLYKKDRLSYEILLKKMDEIINAEDVAHYKNLRAPLQDFKRVHVRSSFVLLFKYDESNDEIIFYDFNHHDNIYK